MKKKILWTLLILTLGALGLVLAHAQSIDCTNYQNQVKQDQTQLHDIWHQFNQDNANLGNCETIQNTVNSPVYQQTMASLQVQAAQGVNYSQSNLVAQ